MPSAEGAHDGSEPHAKGLAAQLTPCKVLDYPANTTAEVDADEGVDVLEGRVQSVKRFQQRSKKVKSTLSTTSQGNHRQAVRQSQQQKQPLQYAITHSNINLLSP